MEAPGRRGCCPSKNEQLSLGFYLWTEQHFPNGFQGSAASGTPGELVQLLILSTPWTPQITGSMKAGSIDKISRGFWP